MGHLSPLDGVTARPAGARARRFAGRGALGWGAGACALAAIGLAPCAALAADPPTLIRSNSTPSVTCVAGPANTVRARVGVQMTVVNYDHLRDWADHMEARVRLEPTTAGLNFTRSWSAWKTPYLVQNKRHRYLIVRTSDNVSGLRAWKVHLKLIWHRPAPVPNISKDLYLKFNGSCATGTLDFGS
jgi:hypothetical protein